MRFSPHANPVADISLLRDVADALKHHRPDRPSATVLASTDVATVSMGFGQMRFGEGKFDGVEQVVITKKDGDMRALTSVLQNVFDAWMTLLGQPLCRRLACTSCSNALRTCFPPPWTIEENNDACFIVKDPNGRRWRMSTSRMNRATCSGEPANQGRGAAHGGELRQTAGAAASVVTD
jgi:hypothetical protein